MGAPVAADKRTVSELIEHEHGYIKGAFYQLCALYTQGDISATTYKSYLETLRNVKRIQYLDDIIEVVVEEMVEDGNRGGATRICAPVLRSIFLK